MLAFAGPVEVGVSLGLLGAYAAPYAIRVRTLHARRRPVPGWRIGCFGAGLVLLAAAVSPPVDRAADDRLSAHMLEHLALGDVAPLLLVLGLTGPMIAPLLRTRGVWRARWLAHPVVAIALWTGALYGWHLRFAYEAAVDHDLVHVFQHVCFFAAGMNLWFALLGPLPKPAWFGNGARLAFVLAVWAVGMMLAYGLVWSDNAFYPHYAETAEHAGRSVTADQSAAGAVMLVEQSVVIVSLLGWLLARALRDAERRQTLADVAASHGVTLDARRIARAVAAEQHDALERRVRTSVPADNQPRATS